MNCLHCRRAVKYPQRGLCKSCYRRLDIRRLYPVQERKSRETDADLDALVARRLAEPLPSWWETASKQARAPRWTTGN